MSVETILRVENPDYFHYLRGTMRRFLVILPLLFFVLLGAILKYKKGPIPNWNAQSPLSKIYFELGVAVPSHALQTATAEMAKQGEELVKTGITNGPDGKKVPLQSHIYKCTHCHNLVQEDPSLLKSDPEARLVFAVKNEIPFLQGSTFWGIVNRETWYNDDYQKKYGDWVEKARNNIREAIQLCSTTCSAGRELEPWEINSIIAYFYTIEMRLGDLGLNENELKKLNDLASRDRNETVRFLKSFYLQKSPATFSDAPNNKSEGYAFEGDKTRGERMYNQSCLFCHGANGPSKYLKLDNSHYSKNFFTRNFTKSSHFSLYEVIRRGTHSIKGHKAYMPNYTQERMSDQQVEDLRAFFESKN